MHGILPRRLHPITRRLPFSLIGKVEHKRIVPGRAPSSSICERYKSGLYRPVLHVPHTGINGQHDLHAIGQIALSGDINSAIMDHRTNGRHEWRS